MEIKSINFDVIKGLLQDEKIRERVILVAAAVLIFLYFIILLLPKSIGFFSRIKEAAELKEQITLVRTRVEQSDVMTKKLGGLEKDLAGYSESLPAEKEIPKFLEGMSEIAKISGVKIVSITPSDLKDTGDKGGGFYKEMPIIITAESGYHELGSFVSNLESGNRVVSIENLRITGKEDGSRNHEVQMTLKTYVSG